VGREKGEHCEEGSTSYLNRCGVAIHGEGLSGGWSRWSMENGSARIKVFSLFDDDRSFWTRILGNGALTFQY
jgi:hypothetical protein